MSKHLKYIIPIALFIACFFSYQKSNTKSENKSYQQEEKLLPTDHLYFQRSFPDNTLNIKAIDKMKAEISLRIAQNVTQRSLDDTPWTIEGPTNIGGRINCIAVHPEDNNTIITGSAAGGMYRTFDGGSTWNSIGDNIAELSISSIVYDPNDPNILYVGTGDHNISITVNVGDGIYKSTDGGETWSHMGLTDQRIISRIIVNPENSQEIYAATMGMPFERNNDRGLYKSTDGGSTWSQVLFVSDEAGIIDLVMNPENPDQLYAASWNRIRNNSESIVSGTDAHIYRTNDGGTTWETLDAGLPMEEDEPVSRIGLTMSHQNPGKVFCLIVGAFLDVQGVYSLDSNTSTWNDINAWDLDGALGGFGWYFGQIRVNPNDDSDLAVLGVDLMVSQDGGASWTEGAPPWFTYEVHADKHDMVYLDNGTVLLATDGGLYKQDLQGNWTDIDNIPNSQFYRIAVNPFADEYAGGLQDNGTVTGDAMDINDWSRDRGGDGFQPIFSPDDPVIMYSETQRGGLARKISGSWTNFTDGIESSDRKSWDMPFIMSSHNSEVLYTGTYRIYKNTNAYIDNWQAISPSLTGAVINSSSFHTITAIGESLENENYLYSGSSDAKVFRSLDAGDSWDDVSAGLPERYVTDIKTSPIDENIVYVSHSGYKDNDNTSHIHRSDNNGDTWIDISGDLPALPINHMELIDDDQLVIATDFGVYITHNGGSNWMRVGNNMPMIPVFDLAVDYDNDKLLAGTFARSMWSFPLDSLLDINVGIDENQSSNPIQVYPNPVVDVMTIASDVPLSRVCVYDVEGRLWTEVRGEGKDRITIDISSASVGLYMVTTYDLDGHKFVQNVVKN